MGFDRAECIPPACRLPNGLLTHSGMPTLVLTAGSSEDGNNGELVTPRYPYHQRRAVHHSGASTESRGRIVGRRENRALPRIGLRPCLDTSSSRFGD
jgi:hypothetical protein